MLVFDAVRCTGCGACKQACPVKCIKMKEDAEGFLVPTVSEEVCMHCGLCNMVCPWQTYTGLPQKESLSAYALKLKDNNRIMKSSSGGAFSSLAIPILEMGGYVYGCAFDNNMQARHIEISSVADLELLHGSKYVQSDIGDCYVKAKFRIEAGALVLFSGTGCQIAGLKAYLEYTDYPNLYTIDIICHGVPSPRLFANYLEWLAKKHKGNILAYEFRNKERTGWGLGFMAKIKTKTKTKTIYKNLIEDPYYSAFLRGDTCRECCYSCAYAKRMRVSDITIGDYWGIQRMHSDFFSEKGVSAVLINTEKGKGLLGKALSKVEIEQASIEDISRENGNLIRPTVRPTARNHVYAEGFSWEMFDTNSRLKSSATAIYYLKKYLKIVLPKPLIKVIKRLSKNNRYKT